MPGTGANPQVLASGDGVVWFLDQKLNRIGDVDPSGTVRELPQDGFVTLNDLLPVSGGNLWVSGTDASGPVLAELSPTGKEIHHVVALGGTGPLVLGPDGHVWFSWSGGLGELSSTFVAEELLGNADDFPAPVVVDAKGRVWYASAYFGCLFSEFGYYERSPLKAVAYKSNGCADDITVGPPGIAYADEQPLIYEVLGTAGPRPVVSVASRVSSISRYLPTIGEAFSPASSVIVSASIAAGLGIFLVFPSQLFNSTYQECLVDSSAADSPSAPAEATATGHGAEPAVDH